MTPDQLDNPHPIDPAAPEHTSFFKNLQGNILSGHGRDHTVHLFLRLPGAAVADARAVIRQLAAHVTSAHKQETERRQFREHGIPGALFGTLLISANGYRKLGFSEAQLQAAFTEAGGQPRPTRSNFLDGMARHAQSDLGDPPPERWEAGFDTGDIDAMLLLADDDVDHLLRESRRVMDALDGLCEVVNVARGTALRNDDGEGIEHFGYVDGRSQPLFLSTDFADLQADGAIGPDTRESHGGRIDVWNPREPLKLALLADPLSPGADRFGSYFVFRKLEQDVRSFTVAEHVLADALGLKDADRERAGAMAVGRFRDGTSLVLSQTDGHLPVQDNNFRYDERGGPGDKDALKCPFHSHIRKTNPRGDIRETFGLDEDAERTHRIVRRGIPYGTRTRHPNAFQALDDLPSKDVGLLFMCYQSSIRNQFAFMQRGWANNQDFIKQAAGLDPIIGQLDSDAAGDPPADRIKPKWKAAYGQAAPEVQAGFDGFVTMRGGEFFFAPSIPFLRSL